MPRPMGRTVCLTDLLTEDEYETLRCLMVGESLRTIAVRLATDEQGALTIKRSLLLKLGARCTADAVREGIVAGYR